MSHTVKINKYYSLKFEEPYEIEYKFKQIWIPYDT